MRTRANILQVVAVMAVSLWATAAMATTYSWTGANSGDWTDSGNWDANGVPVDTNPGGNLELDVDNDRIVIDASGAPNPVPVSNIPTFGATTTASMSTPQLDLVLGTSTVSLVAQGIYHGNSWWTTTVGDGNTNNGLAVLNYNMNVDCLNRHNNGGVHFTVENDGTLNITNSKAGRELRFSFGGAGHATYFTVGGTLNLQNSVQLDGLSANYFELTSVGASVTAYFTKGGESYGSSYADIADVEAELGDELDFRRGGLLANSLTLAATDNLDGTFTVDALGPLTVVLTNTTVQSSASVGTAVSDVFMYENGSETNGFTFSVVAVDDYQSFTVVGSELRTALAMTNGIYSITLHGTNSASGRSTNTQYDIDISFPAGNFTNEWTGAVDGDWEDPYNWGNRRVPASGTWDLSGRILIDAAGATAPVPTNVPTFGNYEAPQFDWAYGTGTVSVTEIWKTGANWTTTVGDGSTANGLAELNYTFSANTIHRHIDYYVRFTVEDDATLNISNPGATLLFGFGSRMPACFILGGTLTFEKAIDLSRNTGNYMTLTNAAASVTAAFGTGSSFTNLADVTAAIGDSSDFRGGGAIASADLVAIDNLDGTFTVAIPSAAGTLFIFE